MRSLTTEEKAVLKQGIEASQRLMKNTATYKESDQEMQLILLNAAMEMGALNFYCASPDNIHKN